MYFIYWFVKASLLLLILYIGSVYLNDLGLWSVVIGVGVFLAGNGLINRIMEQYIKKTDD
ncbi:hypothetical protein [Neobacillus jeddahensis]|uniref:hypothetical protein n=1 Tax=Neobacillus jeddahensis TaxID=1461580 RepID=UPI000942AE20|nr:hypothetical protein [Neobacillus jeddahensis]